MSLEVNTNTKPAAANESSLLSQFGEEFLFKNALILVDHGDYDLALNLLDTILSENEYHQESLKWRGYCLTQLGKIEGAIDSFYKLAEINPTDTNLFQLAEAFYTAGQDDLAKIFYYRCIEETFYESPHLFEIYKKLGNIFTKNHDFESAEENYNKAYGLNPHSDDLFVNYGTLEIQKENFDLALERFKKALSLNQNNDKAWVGLALIYRTRGDLDLSWGELLRALDINPKNTIAIKLAIDWGLKEMEYDAVIQVLEKYLAIAEPNADWIYTYAGVLFQSGDWKESKKVLEYLLIEKPDYLPAQELMKKIDHKTNI